jgi:hypothetical protein
MIERNMQKADMENGRMNVKQINRPERIRLMKINDEIFFFVFF